MTLGGWYSTSPRIKSLRGVSRGSNRIGRQAMDQTRRDFIKAGVMLGGAASLPQLIAQSPRLETFSDWIQADRDARKRGVEQCLERIRTLDTSIHAWVQVQPEQPTADGPLSGIPFGAKDIIETKSMATEYGSPLYKGRVGTTDAAIIREMRSRGAVLVGKTVTTAFAYFTPGPTRNPRNLEHTPGGSSSGSAAAVAAGMVPFTIGEQTGGAIVRPASFCGITGFKPTYDLLLMEGGLPLSKRLDTLGFYTHTPADMIALWKALGRSVGAEANISFAAPEPMPDCEPEMANAFPQAIALLRRSGISIRPVDIADQLKKLNDASVLIRNYEGARFHEANLKKFGDRFDQTLADLVRDGLKIPAQRYNEARHFVADSRRLFAEIFRSTPVILTPAAPGPAPLGLSSTGDPRMNAPWTAMGNPAVSIP